jgi:hypothetical protein
LSILQNAENTVATVSVSLKGFLLDVGALLQAGISSVATAQQLLALASAVTQKGSPDATDWDALHVILDANTAALNAPLPD